jgi:hypothetical protein
MGKRDRSIKAVCLLFSKKGIVELEDGLINREQANEAVAAIRDPSQPLRRKNPENEIQVTFPQCC